MAYFTSAHVLKVASDRKSFDAVTIPEGITIPTIAIPDTAFQEIPEIRAVVLLWVLDSFGARFIVKLTDPFPDTEFSRTNTPPGAEPFMEPGEVQIGSKGGANVFLNNEGDVVLLSGNAKEKLEISASEEAILGTASFVEFVANSDSTITRPFLALDAFGSIRLGVENPQTSTLLTKTVLHEISIDVLGNILVKNLAGGSVSISALGSVTVTGGAVSIVATTASITASSTTINSADINLGATGRQKLATESFVKNFYDLHTHLSATPATPTGPPVIPAAVVPTNLTIVTDAA